MHYSLMLIYSFLGTKYFELEGNILRLEKLGKFLRRWFRFQDTPERVSKRIERAMHLVPLNVKCLDQAIVTWFGLNLHGHPAILRIGLSITPLESHAWVVQGKDIFVSLPNIPDLSVVAEYPAW